MTVLALAPLLAVRSTGSTLQLAPSGSWTATHVVAMEGLFESVEPQLHQATALSVDMAGVRELDTLGAWLLDKMARRATHVGRSAQVFGIAENYSRLIEEVRQVNRQVSQRQSPPNAILAGLNDVGQSTLGAAEDIAAFLQMLGALCMSSLHTVRRSVRCE